jgi:uncharacterized protein (TIGR03435 family)
MKAKLSTPDTPTNIERNGSRIDAKACPMPRLAMRLSAVLGAPVEDVTQVAGEFDFSLKWIPDDMRAGAPAPETPDGPSLFTALQEQLGLKLEARKVSADVMVIDRAQLPSQN